MSSLKYPSILVIGAGELGKAVLHALAREPYFSDISVLLRPATIQDVTDAQASSDKPSIKVAELQSLQALGIKFVPGDYITDSETALTETFHKYHTVIGCSGYAHGAAGVQPKLAKVALVAGVQRYFPWQFGVDYDVLGQGSSQDLFDEQLAVRRLLRSQTGTSWVILSVGMFQSFLLDNPDFGILDRERRIVRALGSWETEITVTAAEDIGKGVAGILVEEPEIKDGVVFVAGDTLSYEKLADDLDRFRAPGTDVYVRELWDVEHLQQELAADPTNGLKKYRPIFASREGIAWSKENRWNGQRGIKMRTIEDELALKRSTADICR